MAIKITTPNGGGDALNFGCARTAIAATVTGTEVSSGEGKLEFKTTTGGTSAAKMTIAANGAVTLATPLPVASGGTGSTTGGGLGVGQTWQVLTGSRAIDTQYTNSTGRPIKVAVTWIGEAGATVDEFLIGGVVIHRWSSIYAAGGTWTMSEIVPAGSTYQMNALTLVLWNELR
jgi:hypothetical protein